MVTLNASLKNNALPLIERVRILADTSKQMADDGRAMNIAGYVDAVDALISYPTHYAPGLCNKRVSFDEAFEAKTLQNLRDELRSGVANGDQFYTEMAHPGFVQVLERYFVGITR
ncbi:TPA: hypothetical protein HA251_01300 [Candidatus Woesearchaeota archaeon]|nr:MAG: hypothetical protein UY85_C0084G0003 [Candidatus Peribacteria bacterium GW2011_GWB1_54_5]HIH23649.1 hypothetical protein [Candidatus Woesearchaeota archaeon]